MLRGRDDGNPPEDLRQLQPQGQGLAGPAPGAIRPPGPRRLLVAWDDTQITPGAQWREKIARALDEADIAVLLVSPGFLASDFIAQHEFQPLLAKKRVFWVAVSASVYGMTELEQYQCANNPAKPLDGLSKAARNKALVEICEKILAAATKEPNGTPSGELFQVPYPKNPYFTGRKQVLDDLGAALATGKPTVLTGLGGVGKTQTAVKYAYCHRNDYSAVLWRGPTPNRSSSPSSSRSPRNSTCPRRTRATPSRPARPSSGGCPGTRAIFSSWTTPTSRTCSSPSCPSTPGATSSSPRAPTTSTPATRSTWK